VNARSDIGLLVLRLAGFGLLCIHGWGTLVALAGGQTGFADSVARLGFPAPLVFAWAAALGETLGGLLVGLGLFTRFAAPVCAFTMAVAAFGQHHAHQHLLVRLHLRSAGEDTLKAWGSPEMALLYLACFLAVALMGAGRYSLDHLLGTKGKSRGSAPSRRR
jgi:putative oxidoreductase